MENNQTSPARNDERYRLRLLGFTGHADETLHELCLAADGPEEAEAERGELLGRHSWDRWELWRGEELVNSGPEPLTPDPWRVEPAGGGHYLIRAYGSVIAEVGGEGRRPEEAEQNAYAISAVPDALEACSQLDGFDFAEVEAQEGREVALYQLNNVKVIADQALRGARFKGA